MIERTERTCSLCRRNLLIEQDGIAACVECDLAPASPPVYVSTDGVYTPADHCSRGCGSRLTLADRGTVCRQCVLEGMGQP